MLCEPGTGCPLLPELGEALGSAEIHPGYCEVLLPKDPAQPCSSSLSLLLSPQLFIGWKGKRGFILAGGIPVLTEAGGEGDVVQHRRFISLDRYNVQETQEFRNESVHNYQK